MIMNSKLDKVVKLKPKKIKVEVIVIGGKPCVRAKDLTPNPTNAKIYNQSAKGIIVDSYLERREKGFKILNQQPVTYWPSGMIDAGHTRTDAAIEVDEEFIWAVPSDAPEPDDSAPYDEVKHTIDGNIVREKNWSVKLGEWQCSKDAYREQFGFDMPSSVEEKLIKSLGTTKSTLKKVADIKHHKPECMKDIDEGASVDHTWKFATGKLDTTIVPEKTNGLDLTSLFKDGDKSKIVTTAIKYAKDFRDLKMQFGEFDISPFGHDPCGKWESGAFTTFLSHTFMSSIAGVLKEKGYEVKTANGHRDDPDIFLVNEDEKIEVKCTQFNGHGASTKWSGGKGIREGKYLLIAHDLEFSCIFVAFTSLTKDDWGKPDINNKKTMKLSDWFMNHRDDEDLQLWKGNVNLIKTNKMKEGQVQMLLSALDDPI